MIKTSRLFAALTIAGLAGSAIAAPIAAFDYGTGDAQAGFTKVTAMSGVTIDTNGVGIEVTGGTEFRDRNNLAGDPLQELLNDIAFENDVLSVVFTLTGLDANTNYTVTVYAYDSESGNNGKVTDWSTNGGSVQVTHTTDTSDTSSAPFDLSLTTDASGSATIEAARVGGNNIIIWNGFEIVPEPSSLALLGLGGLLIARRRRD